MDKQHLEKYSSAFTLSDMEIFIFPELMYALVLANIMSPEIWKWRDDKWFARINKMSPLKRIHRVKQYIMDHYTFNLDLETWGLTDKQTEISRFSGFIDPGVLASSNALFGYEGDQYYFDINIRRHFGLDKYESDVIPYWKTETVEAMNAFRYKPGHETAAGECVSLACLYVAALFIVAGIPLEKIFMMGTPLHSQNFILSGDGILTNNRRILTKAMWYNGSELSSLARRALEHEQITIVAHVSGFIHSLFPDATIDPEQYRHFTEKLAKYLEAKVNFETFINFLRDYSRYQHLFQIAFSSFGSLKFIRLEKAFGYEHGSKNRLGDKTGNKMLTDIDEDELQHVAYENMVILSAGDELFKGIPCQEFMDALLEKSPSLRSELPFIASLKKFFHTIPNLPSPNKQFSPLHHVTTSTHHQFIISPILSREEIIEYLSGFRQGAFNSPQSSVLSRHLAVKSHESQNPHIEHRASNIEHPASVVDLAFYAGRYMDSCDWEPFLKAAFERNPVSVSFFKDSELRTAYSELMKWSNESIYDGNRLALPDEVVNFKRGDGIEKAICLTNIILSRFKGKDMRLAIGDHKTVVSFDDQEFVFNSMKNLSFHKSWVR